MASTDKDASPTISTTAATALGNSNKLLSNQLKHLIKKILSFDDENEEGASYSLQADVETLQSKYFTLLLTSKTNKLLALSTVTDWDRETQQCLKMVNLGKKLLQVYNAVRKAEKAALSTLPSVELWRHAMGLMSEEEIAKLDGLENILKYAKIWTCRALISKGFLAESVETLTQLLKLDNSLDFAWQVRGEAYYEMDCPLLALVHFNQPILVEKSPKLAEEWRAKCINQIARHRNVSLHDRINVLGETENFFELNLEEFFHRAELLFREGYYLSCSVLLCSVLKVASQLFQPRMLFRALLLLAQCYRFRKTNLAQGIQLAKYCIRVALFIDPPHGEANDVILAYLERAKLYFDAARYEDSAEDTARILSFATTTTSGDDLDLKTSITMLNTRANKLKEKGFQAPKRIAPMVGGKVKLILLDTSFFHVIPTAFVNRIGFFFGALHEFEQLKPVEMDVKQNVVEVISYLGVNDKTTTTTKTTAGEVNKENILKIQTLFEECILQKQATTATFVLCSNYLYCLKPDVKNDNNNNNKENGNNVFLEWDEEEILLSLLDVVYLYRSVHGSSKRNSEDVAGFPEKIVRLRDIVLGRSSKRIILESKLNFVSIFNHAEDGEGKTQQEVEEKFVLSYAGQKFYRGNTNQPNGGDEGFLGNDGLLSNIRLKHLIGKRKLYLLARIGNNQETKNRVEDDENNNNNTTTTTYYALYNIDNHNNKVREHQDKAGVGVELLGLLKSTNSHNSQPQIVYDASKDDDKPGLGDSFNGLNYLDSPSKTPLSPIALLLLTIATSIVLKILLVLLLIASLAVAFYYK